MSLSVSWVVGNIRGILKEMEKVILPEGDWNLFGFCNCQFIVFNLTYCRKT